MTTWGFTDFVRRQTADSSFPHWGIPDEEVLCRVEAAWILRRPGYRPGVVLVSVEPDGFFSSVVSLRSGDRLTGSFSPRRADEAPRKLVTTPGCKAAAGAVDVVLYGRDVLAEDGQAAAFDWNIVAILAGTSGDMPMDPETLMANHFHVPGSNDGGTTTGMTDAEFVAALRKSYEFWRDKAQVEEVGP